jgi:hypothetical protein
VVNPVLLRPLTEWVALRKQAQEIQLRAGIPASQAMVLGEPLSREARGRSLAAVALALEHRALRAHPARAGAQHPAEIAAEWRERLRELPEYWRATESNGTPARRLVTGLRRTTRAYGPSLS